MVKHGSGLLLAISFSATLSAQAGQGGLQAGLQASMQVVRQAWHVGDYPTALRSMIELRGRAGGDALHREIALLTGELYSVRDLAPDARSPTISQDGRFVSYLVSGDRQAPPTTRIVALEQPLRTVAEVAGSACVYSADGSIAVCTSPDRARLLVTDLATGVATPLSLAGRSFVGARADARRVVALVAATEDAERTDLVVFTRIDEGFAEPHAIATGKTFKGDIRIVPGGRFVVYRALERDPLAPRARGRRGIAGAELPFVVVDLDGGTETEVPAAELTIAAAEAVIAYTRRDGDGTELFVQSLQLDGSLQLAGRALPAPRPVHREAGVITAPALSPSGRAVAYQARVDDNWEVFVAPCDGGASYRLTHEIQHDVDPIFLDETTVMAQIGEPRHRRAYAYDLETHERTRLFHNNTLRTIAPQYVWQASADGRQVLIQAERDGNTVSPDRAIHVVDRGREVTRDELLQRMRDQLAGELDLRARGESMFAPIDADVHKVVATVRVDTVLGYQQRLGECGSRHLTQPGNEQAREVLVELLTSFGYEPEVQTIRSRGQRRSPMGAGGSGNVIARLTGTRNPELVYVLGSHYDSVARGPGADDNGSGTAVTLEAARVLARHPLPATIVFVAFTGEESGLLGSRDFVRVAAESGMKVVGALNNDMLGWANDDRIDNTIRYSNPGIRDVQHNAALRYSRLITYDALYYKSTDAAAFYEAWGDIVGGIGSYPVLGNPHYHQATDLLSTIDHEQVAETAKTTVATLMLLASSPSRMQGLQVGRTDAGQVLASWQPAPEQGVESYEVVFGPVSEPMRTRLQVQDVRAVLDGARAGDRVAVRAVDDRGLHGWDWAHAVVP